MIITNKLTLDLQTPGTVPTIHAVQNDSYSRNLEIALYEGRKPFVFPVHGTVVIRYKKSDGKGGEYDTLPDGKVAWWTKGNLLTISLAPQVLTTPGSVLLSISLLDSGTQLSVFPIRLAVDPIAAAKAADSENYFYITGLLPAPVTAEIGQCLRISAVADSGRITALEAITPNTLFGNIITQEVTLALETAKATGEFDGATPQKGIDYWTETDQNQIVSDVLAALGTPIFGSVDAENNIILSADLPEGTYILKYEDADGELTEIGTLIHSSYTNLADPTSAEWMAGYRLNSSANVVAANATYLTNFIPCQEGDVLRIKGLNVCGVKGDYTAANTFFFSEDKTTRLAMSQAANIPNPSVSVEIVANAGWTWDAENALWTFTLAPEHYKYQYGDVSGIRYCRFSGELIDGYTENDIIITVNQEIT